MPGGMTGFEVADQARVIRPALRVLLTTGYANGRFSRKGPDRTRHPMLRKPYNLKDLAKTLRELLDQGPRSI
jgi:two-component system CheB/CheR fusion protein